MNADQTFVATVEKVVGRTGSRGGIIQVKVQIQTPKGQRSLLRNVKGNVKPGDKIVLLEAEREAKRVR